jgi:hypothetical protein
MKTNNVHSSQIPTLSLSISQLKIIMRMAEVQITMAEAFDKLYENDELVQTRAQAAVIQAQCEQEILRLGLLANEASQRAAADQIAKQKADADAKKKAADEAAAASKIVTPPPQPQAEVPTGPPMEVRVG